VTEQNENEHPEEGPQPPADAEEAGEAGEPEEDDSLEAGYVAARQVIERNGYFGNMIVVGGDFIGSGDKERGSAVPILDITAHVDAVEDEFVEPPSYKPTLRAIEEHAVALLCGNGCGNRMTASVALRRSGREPIVELPGALGSAALVDAVKEACRDKKTGVLVDSIETETLNGFTGFQMRHLRNSLPDGAAVVFTTRTQRASSPDDETPVIEGAPPDATAIIDLLARRRGIDEVVRERALNARRLLPETLGPAVVSEMVVLAEGTETPEELAALVTGRSQILDEWLTGEPTAKSVAALAAAATLNELPSTDFDAACEMLAPLLEREVEPRPGPATFSARENLWPNGLATHRRTHVPTYFGWQETEVVEICPPLQADSVTRYLWNHLDGGFRRPFLRWLRELPFDSGARLTFAAARTAGILFTVDPFTIERELLRPWALDGRRGLCDGVALALGMPAALGADPTSSRRLLRQWSNTGSANLRKAAIASYGGPLGIWDPSAAAVSNLWSAGWDQPELAELANLSLATLFCGGKEASRARYTATEFLLERATSKDAPRVYKTLPLVLQQLTGGSRMARDSFRALLSAEEAVTCQGLMTLLAMAFESRDGREAAKAAIRNLLTAAAAERISRGDVEALIRGMKEAARARDRMPQLGSLLQQTLKAEERTRGSTREIARSVYETFYGKEGGNAIEAR
jgi:hypothetical protein